MLLGHVEVNGWYGRMDDMAKWVVWLNGWYG